MILTSFIKDIITEGHITVDGKLITLSLADLEHSVHALKMIYERDLLEMPVSPPAFKETAALWAAEYFYIALQCAVIRDIDAQRLEEQLQSYKGEKDAEAIYSADLILRQLSRLMELSRGLAPADILNDQLKQTANDWPFSSVGTEIEFNGNEEVILVNPFLRQVYFDRIIKNRDIKRLKNPHVREGVIEVMGQHSAIFWPGFDNPD